MSTEAHPNNESWPEILTRLESHADSAEALLPKAEDEAPVVAITPWEWVLPDPSALPPLPTELVDRAVAIRDRIDRLKARLASELDKTPSAATHPPADRGSAPETQAIYVDMTV